MSGMVLFVDALGDGPLGSAGVADKIGMRHRTASVYARRLHDARRIHVVDWDGAQRPIYAAGDGIDKPRPRKITKVQFNRRDYRKRKADPLAYFDKLLADRARRARKRRPPVAQTWLSSIQ